MGFYIRIGIGIILVLVGIFLAMGGIHNLRRKQEEYKLFGFNRRISSLGLRWRLWMRLKLFLKDSKVFPVWRPLFIGLILIGGGLYLILTFITHV